MELGRYMVRKGHHGRKDDEGNTVITKPGEPLLLSEQSARKLGDAIRPWPDDKPWPLGPRGEAPMKTTEGHPKATPTPADHAARKAAERDREKSKEDDGHQIKEKG